MKKALLIVFLLCIVFAGHAQDTETVSDEEQTGKGSAFSIGPLQGLFIAPLIEIIGYSRSGPAIGGGLAIGAGDEITIGARFLYAISNESIITMEIAVFFRAYIFGPDTAKGPFVQLNIGSASFGLERPVPIPSAAGDLSLGLGAGWRIPFSNRWYWEPYIRIGYPYIVGAGISAAFRF